MCLTARLDGNIPAVGQSIEHSANYVVAPSGPRSVKLLVVGSIISRNRELEKIPRDATKPFRKPAELSNLSDELFCNFTKDIQLSVACHMTDEWRILVPLLGIGLLITSVAYVYYPLFLLYSCFYDTIALLYGILVAFGYRAQVKDLQSEIEVRIEEWSTLFRHEGFSVTCTTRESFWRPTELYLRIYQSCKPSMGSKIWFCHAEQEAKYLILFARMFKHRNTSFRVLLASKKFAKSVYVKPPALENLSDALFLRLMKDLDKTLRAYMVKKRNICLSLVFFFDFPVFLFSPSELYLQITTGVTAGLLVFFWWIHQFLADQFLFPISGISQCIKKWQPRLAVDDHVIEYCVDQPRWFNWKEGYIHIHHIVT